MGASGVSQEMLRQILRADSFEESLEFFSTYLTIIDAGRDGDLREGSSALYQCLDRHALLVRGSDHDAAEIKELRKHLVAASKASTSSSGNGSTKKSPTSYKERRLREEIFTSEAQVTALESENKKVDARE